MMLPSTRSWVPGSSGSRRRCRIGWCNVCRERRGCKWRAANAAATCAAELLARGLGGRQGGRCRCHVDLSVHPSSRERLLRDPRRSIQGRNASSGAGLLGRQPAGSGRPRWHQATRSRLPRPLWVRESIRHSVTATTVHRFRCSAGRADGRLLECRRPPTHFASRARRCD